ncbi:MAG: adenosine deaminase [Anaerolineales bacterium]
MTEKSLSEFIETLPKAEVHVHFEGSTTPASMLELAKRHNKLDLLPAQDIPGLQQWFQFSDFNHFIDVYIVILELIRTPEDFALLAYRCGEDMAAQNIRYREVTVTPFGHTDMQAEKGMTIEGILEGLEDGRRRAKDEFGVEIRWVFDVPRNLSFPDDDDRYDPYPAERTLEQALLGRDYGVVGYGLGGFEPGAPAKPFSHGFAKARDAGLLCVPHAGETFGPQSVWEAIDDLYADRIGHGVRSIEDPALVEVLKERQIPLEINPTSNICLKVYPDFASHPFRQLDEMGVFVTVNSDDPPLFNTTLTQEYRVLAEEFGYSRIDLARIARNAFVVSGAEPGLKQKLLAEFDAWVAENV